MRSSAFLRASSVMIFLTTWRDRLPLMVAIADFSRSAETSLSATSKPASAATCAMPLPIWPEPITPILLIETVISPSTGMARVSRLLHPKARSGALPTSRETTLKVNTARRFVIRPVQSSLLSELTERLGQFRNRLIEVRDQAVIGDLEDRRVLILVNRDDHLGILHAGEVLNCAGDADRD